MQRRLSSFARQSFFLSLVAAYGCGPRQESRDDDARVYSLTGANYSGKKSYFGWGAAGAGDPAMMHNEVKYDVLHTHDIFTSGVGGSYKGTKFTGSVSAAQIRQQWSSLASASGVDDMYVQYSSGHGFPGGLGVGVSYADMATAALQMKAREIIVFTMACHSGGLVDAFNRRESEWRGFEAAGRTLLVMSSSTVQQTSSTGPGTDPAEQGPTGSAGSAFGHALWKALAGESDGYFDGVKDGYISLGEVVTYATDKTKRIGGHTPQFTGVFDPYLIMNRVPPKSYISGLSGPDSTGEQQYDEGAIRDAAKAADVRLTKERDQLVAARWDLQGLRYSAQIMVAVPTPGDSVELLASAPNNAATITLCEDSFDNSCTQQGGKAMLPMQSIGDVKVFKSATSILLRRDKVVAFVAFDSAGQVIARRSVKVVDQSSVQPITPNPLPQVPQALPGTITLHEMQMTVPAGWVLRQDAVDEGTVVLLLRNGTRIVTIYAARKAIDLKTMFAGSGSQVVGQERAETFNNRSWLRLDASRTLTTGAKGLGGVKYIAAFKLENNSVTYFGYGSGNSSADASASVSEVLSTIR